jgi:hypothetical protein
MTATEIITSSELNNKIALLPEGNKFKTCGDFLISAINDWPTLNLEEPKDFLEELRSKDTLDF